MGPNQYIYHSMGAKNIFGTFDTTDMVFTPDPAPAYAGMYDEGDGHAAKSYVDDIDDSSTLLFLLTRGH